MGNEWEAVGRLRRDFADMIESLNEDQLDAETLCGHWTPRHILGHLVVFVDLSMPQFMLGLLTSGFNYDKAADKMARKQAERPVAELVASLREKAAKPAWVKSFPEELTLSDVAIHTQDVRRSLGLDGELRREDVRNVLSFLSTHKQAKNIYSPAVIEGLHLEATDLDWRHGSGPCVEGPGEALMMAMAGRPTLDELGGDGVATLRERLTG